MDFLLLDCSFGQFRTSVPAFRECRRAGCDVQDPLSAPVLDFSCFLYVARSVNAGWLAVIGLTKHFCTGLSLFPSCCH